MNTDSFMQKVTKSIGDMYSKYCKESDLDKQRKKQSSFSMSKLKFWSDPKTPD